MAIFKDIILDAEGDFSISNGDIFFGESDSQHVDHILLTDLGQFRQFPMLGVGIARLINGSINKIELSQKIRLNLESDNYNVSSVNVEDANKLSINIDANRKDI